MFHCFPERFRSVKQRERGKLGWSASSNVFSKKSRSKKRRREEDSRVLIQRQRTTDSPSLSTPAKRNSRKRRFDHDENLVLVKRPVKRSKLDKLQKKFADLNVKNDVEKKSTRKRKFDHDENLALEKRPVKRSKLDQLQKKLADLNVKNDVEKKSNSLALVLVKKAIPRLNIVSPSEIKLSKNSHFALAHRLKLDPKLVSKKVLQTLCSLGCVEKISLMGQDFYMVLKNKLIPVFPKPSQYYFERQKRLPSSAPHDKHTEKPITVRTLVGLWLLLVQMGHFIPFPEVRSLHRMFSPEVNDDRLNELGQTWLKQLGVEEHVLLEEKSLMDKILQRLVVALMRGRRALANEAERWIEPMQEIN